MELKHSDLTRAWVAQVGRYFLAMTPSDTPNKRGSVLRPLSGRHTRPLMQPRLCLRLGDATEGKFFRLSTHSTGSVYMQTYCTYLT